MPKRLLNSFATLFNRGRSLATSIKSKPSFASKFAYEAPIPAVAPVISAVAIT